MTAHPRYRGEQSTPYALINDQAYCKEQNGGDADQLFLCVAMHENLPRSKLTPSHAPAPVESITPVRKIEG